MIPITSAPSDAPNVTDIAIANSRNGKAAMTSITEMNVSAKYAEEHGAPEEQRRDQQEPCNMKPMKSDLVRAP